MSASPDMVERVARAIIDANERREKSATHGMEIVAEAALEASHHAELVEALRRIQDEANTVCGDWRETASLIDSICLAALHNIGGDA